jgi:hypothetical protein
VPKPLAVVPDLDSELDALHALPPGKFTQARNDLARRLKQAGRTEAATDVRQLRKPTVPVWAVNQLARRHASEVKALLEASEQLRTAQGAAIGGEETEKLRQATAAQRDALQTLTHRGHDFLQAEGQSATSAVIERIASILRAAAVDPESRALLESGRLNEELDPSGFDAFAGMPLPPRSRGRGTGTKPREDRKRKEEQVRKLRDSLRQAEAAAEEAEQEVERAESAAARANREAERVRAALQAAENDLKAGR